VIAANVVRGAYGRDVKGRGADVITGKTDGVAGLVFPAYANICNKCVIAHNNESSNKSSAVADVAAQRCTSRFVDKT